MDRSGGHGRRKPLDDCPAARSSMSLRRQRATSKCALPWSFFRRARTVYRDEIIVEVWRNRDAYVGKHKHSLADIVADLEARQRRPGCTLVDRREGTGACSQP